jgi:predicted transcriptional regulator
MSSGAYNTRSRRVYGLRGKALARKREQMGIGQTHVAISLGMLQPDLSRLERETFGGMPRGFSSRYLDALEGIQGKASQHFPKCGCRL